MAPIPQNIRSRLAAIEPEGSFHGSLPRVESSSGRTFYVKFGQAINVEQWKGEAESLVAMNDAAPGIAPKLLDFGLSDDGCPYFISEYKDIGSLSSGQMAAEVLAKRLASEMHMKTNPEGKFGFPIPTYCGVTRLRNGLFETWKACYAAQLEDLLQQLKDKGNYKQLCEKLDRVINDIVPKLLGSLNVEPVILHGDLWSGNAGVDRSSGQPVIFDPASYYGHNEADLSIARMFGGFPQAFYKTYHEIRPKTEPVDQYDHRANLYELFHHINHTLIFGGSYAGSSERLMNKLLLLQL
ncbi:fructosamine kinase PKL/CAK/FruK [Crepidotus variabilis]|uniref:protein-ribulosamine 3-kinase n=1 Tax=Crepidotus variabilis TaxID=179855 RepID=A0A9P6JWV7_9AGAR|nr:fructosamine kinase PKL/CAK/FruK [Crepidotus variabilis]